MRQGTYTGITHPKGFCRLRQYCPIGGRDRAPPMLISSLGRKQTAKVRFPRFVPEIDITV
ncbi:MAG: hypothetical protein FGF51_06800 [Candidatus Brockarchaeota archaeon]|nr:hypothetical protein [Candidatus Brockarchaeota archaeon]